MTTIAWRSPVLATDSQITHGNTRYCLSIKLKRLPNGALVAWSGALVDGARLIALLEKNGGKLTEKIIQQCSDIEALYVSPDGKVMHVEGGDNGGAAPIEGEFFANGSGYVAALAAMKAGADAVRAIEIAAELDTATSLPVVSLTLEPVEPKKKRKTR